MTKKQGRPRSGGAVLEALRAKRPNIPDELRKTIERQALAMAALDRMDPEQPLTALRALGMLAAFAGLRGEVDEEELTLRLFPPESS